MTSGASTSPQQEKSVSRQSRADGSAQQTNVKTDAKPEQRLARDLEKIGRYVPNEIFNSPFDHLTRDFFLDTFRSHPDKAHTTAVLFSAKSFQNLSPEVKRLVAMGAFSLTQNWTTESVTQLKNLVTSESFAKSGKFTQIEMSNKFFNELAKAAQK